MLASRVTGHILFWKQRRMEHIKAFIILSVTCTVTVLSYSSSTVHSDPTSSLRETLKKFTKTRHHDTNPREKRKARKFIKKTFRKAGLHVWSEKFVLKPKLSGENIVGMLKAKSTGTADDRIVVVGAHYDTTKNTRGVDDNGSGMTALMEVAKQIGRAGCRLHNTVMFVAFDFEEGVAECNYDVSCQGSKFFVQNLTSYLNMTGGTVEGALILEMLANHNSSKDSQLFPDMFSYVSPTAYKEVTNDGNRGNFLAVIGRGETDKRLLSSLKKFYQNDSDYRVQLVPFPLFGRPTESDTYRFFRHFYRSDNYHFWENVVSFKAVMLTDTSEYRRNMDKCYHKRCDNMKQITENDLEFLRRNVNAVIQTTLELSETDSCNSSDAEIFVIVDPCDSCGDATIIACNLTLLLISISSIFTVIN